MMGSETDDINEELRKSLLRNYEKDLKEQIRGCEFIPDSIDLLYYRLQNIDLKKRRSHVDSPKWLKNKQSNNRSIK